MPDEAKSAEVLVAAGMSTDGFALAVRQLPGLAWVHTVSAGVDRYVPALRGTGVALTRTEHARAAPMAEHVLAVSLALLRGLPAAWESGRSREWVRRKWRTLEGATVGIVGAGAVGRAAASRFAALGARCIGTKRTPSALPGFTAVLPPAELPVLLEASDVVVLTCPLTDATRGLIAASELSAMKPTAFLVNVARGGVVVEADLVEALHRGNIAGAALDVFEVEPLPADHPLWTAPNVIITPHSSSAVPTVKDAAISELTANLRRRLAGEPLDGLVDVDGDGY